MKSSLCNLRLRFFTENFKISTDLIIEYSLMNKKSALRSVNFLWCNDVLAGDVTVTQFPLFLKWNAASKRNVYFDGYSFTKCTTALFRTGHRWLSWLSIGLPCRGREFDSGRINTQGLKITEKKVLPL